MSQTESSVSNNTNPFNFKEKVRLTVLLIILLLVIFIIPILIILFSKFGENEGKSNTSTSDSSVLSTVSKIPFTQNESNFVTFNYPSQWNVNFQSHLLSGQITKFEDLDFVILNNVLELKMNGVMMCGAVRTDMIDNSETYTLLDESQKINTYQIKDFEYVKLDIPSDKEWYLLKFTEIRPSEDTTSTNEIHIEIGRRMTSGVFRFNECQNAVILNTVNFKSFPSEFVVSGIINDYKYDLTTWKYIVEDFANSFQKK